MLVFSATSHPPGSLIFQQPQGGIIDEDEDAVVKRLGETIRKIAGLSLLRLESTMS